MIPWQREVICYFDVVISFGTLKTLFYRVYVAH